MNMLVVLNKDKFCPTLKALCSGFPCLSIFNNMALNESQAGMEEEKSEGKQEATDGRGGVNEEAKGET